MRNFHNLNTVKNSTWPIFFWVFLMVIVLHDWTNLFSVLVPFPDLPDSLVLQNVYLGVSLHARMQRYSVFFLTDGSLAVLRLKGADTHRYSQRLGQNMEALHRLQPDKIPAWRESGHQVPSLTKELFVIDSTGKVAMGFLQHSVTGNINNDLVQASWPERIAQHKRDCSL